MAKPSPTASSTAKTTIGLVIEYIVVLFNCVIPDGLWVPLGPRLNLIAP